MLRRLRRRVERPPAGSLPSDRLAAAVLLVEIARADFHIDPRERAAIRRVLASAYDLRRDEAADLVARAEAAAEESVSLYEFTRPLNEALSPADKVEIVEMLWRVAFADGRLDKYEEHQVRKTAELLYVPHRRFIRAKLEVGREPARARSLAARANR